MQWWWFVIGYIVIAGLVAGVFFNALPDDDWESGCAALFMAIGWIFSVPFVIAFQIVRRLRGVK